MSTPDRQRDVNPARNGADAGDRWWPLAATVVLAAGTLTALIVAKGDFDAPWGWTSARLHLAAVAALATVALVSIAFFRGAARRRMQLGVLVSLLAHLWLCIGLYHTYVSFAGRPSDRPETPSEIEPDVTLPDYHLPGRTEPTNDPLSQPVEVEPPRPSRVDHHVEQPSVHAQRPATIEPASDEPAPPAESPRASRSAARRGSPTVEVANLPSPSLSRHQAEATLADEPPIDAPRPSAEPAPSVELRAQQIETSRQLAQEPAPGEFDDTSAITSSPAPIESSPPPIEASRRVEDAALTPEELGGPTATGLARSTTIAPAVVPAGRPVAQIVAVEPAPESRDELHPGAKGSLPRNSDRPLAAAARPAASAAGVETNPTLPASDVGQQPVPPLRRTVDVPAVAADAADANIDTRVAGPTTRSLAPASTVELESRVDMTAVSPPSAEPASATEHMPTAPAMTPAPAALAGRVEPAVTLPRERPRRMSEPFSAAEGVEGLPRPDAIEPGVDRRHARADRDLVAPSFDRMAVERAGARVVVDAEIRELAAPQYRQRDPELRSELVRSYGGSAASERAVEMGLDFLARHQNPAGSWSLQGFAREAIRGADPGDGQMVSDTAATGLALLAFLGAGYTHVDGPYREAVGRGLDDLIGHQKPDGDLFRGGSQYCWLYSHGIAAMALSEAYAMTGDLALREPAQRAIEFIAAAQNPQLGGWRYEPGSDADTSVSGWQLMALKSSQMAGLEVPPEVFARVTDWLDGARAAGYGDSRYIYNPSAPADQPHQRAASPVMTAEALLMRMYLGWRRENPAVVAGADYLRKSLPSYGTRRSPARDCYYWYYATQVMFQMQGEHWNDWNARLRPLLIVNQTQTGPLAGSWDPLTPVADRWGPAAGRIYVTSMHLLMLEVYYRHLPLYQDLGG